jgi:hypothetical protein
MSGNGELCEGLNRIDGRTHDAYHEIRAEFALDA